MDEKKLRAILTERQFERLTLYAIRGMTVEQIAEQKVLPIRMFLSRLDKLKRKLNFSLKNRVQKYRFKRDR